MNSNINFNELWKGQQADQPTTQELQKKTRKLKYTGLLRMLFITLTFVATALFVCWIWYKYKPEMLTTKIGMILTLLALFIYGISFQLQFPLLIKLDSTENNAAYLDNLLALKRKQQQLQTTILNLYFILLSSGILLYMIEPSLRMTVFWRIMSYALSIIWFLFCWFYLRPRQTKKQQSKLDELIKKYELLQSQLS
ncbi:MAG TPA: hypothetical protein PKO18_02805 [Chitinophagales bacterium]|nr:hypothetical protein [Chitinophagales bacterium]